MLPFYPLRRSRRSLTGWLKLPSLDECHVVGFLAGTGAKFRTLPAREKSPRVKDSSVIKVTRIGLNSTIAANAVRDVLVKVSCHGTGLGLNAIAHEEKPGFFSDRTYAKHAYLLVRRGSAPVPTPTNRGHG